MNKLRRFTQLAPVDRHLLISAILELGLARIMLLLFPFRQLAERLSKHNGAEGKETDREYLNNVAWAVKTAARHVPWRSDCFPQAIAALKLLQRRGLMATLHIGVAKYENNKLTGHAWLTWGRHIITGGPDISQFTELHRIPPSSAA